MLVFPHAADPDAFFHVSFILSSQRLYHIAPVGSLSFFLSAFIAICISKHPVLYMLHQVYCSFLRTLHLYRAFKIFGNIVTT
jgi:hypothetical protein